MKRLIYRYYDYNGSINGTYSPSISILQISNSTVIDSGSMVYNGPLKAYIYDFDDYIESIEYLADIDFGNTAIVRYASLSFGGSSSSTIDETSLVNSISTRITQDHGTGKYNQVGGGGGTIIEKGLSKKEIDDIIEKSSKGLKERIESLKESILDIKSQITVVNSLIHSDDGNNELLIQYMRDVSDTLKKLEKEKKQIREEIEPKDDKEKDILIELLGDIKDDIISEMSDESDRLLQELIGHNDILLQELIGYGN